MRAVPAETTFPLRQVVLRPNQRTEELAEPRDDDPDAGHYAAFDDAGHVVGTGTVGRHRPPWAPGGPGGETGPGWQIRGMAVAPGQRGRGIGSAVLSALLAHVREHGGGLVWCNARVPARGLYEHAGFHTVGEPFELEHIGLHIVMATHVPPPTEARTPRN